jgi:transposase
VHTLFVGIDVSMHTNEVLAMLQDGREVDSFRVANDLPGAEALVERLVKLVTSRRLERVVLGVEATGIYSWHLVQHLRQAPALQPFQPVVHTFNPKVVRGFKQAYPELPKTDRVDAWVIADRLRLGRLPAPGVLEDRYEALRRLTRTLYHLVQDLVRAKQRFLNALFLKFSSFAQDKPVGRTFGATALAFTVETECIEVLAATPIEELLATIPNTLGSVKGLGPVYVAGIVAEIADIWRFRNHNAVAKYAGLAWSRHQSGKFESEETRLIRTGNRYLRYYLIEAACSLAVHDAEFQRYYQRKKAESKTHAHQRALALTARKLVRLVDHLLRSNRLYNPLGAPTR